MRLWEKEDDRRSTVLKYLPDQGATSLGPGIQYNTHQQSTGCIGQHLARYILAAQCKAVTSECQIPRRHSHHTGDLKKRHYCAKRWQKLHKQAFALTSCGGKYFSASTSSLTSSTCSWGRAFHNLLSRLALSFAIFSK